MPPPNILLLFLKTKIKKGGGGEVRLLQLKVPLAAFTASKIKKTVEDISYCKISQKRLVRLGCPF